MRLFVLSHQIARERAVQAVREAPEGFAVKVMPPKRSLDQNALLHARLTEIAAKHEWAGKTWDLEVWKRLLTAAWLRARGDAVVVLPALDGFGVDVVFRRTSDLSQAECAELIEFVDAWEASL